LIIESLIGIGADENINNNLSDFLYEINKFSLFPAEWGPCGPVPPFLPRGNPDGFERRDQ